MTPPTSPTRSPLSERLTALEQVVEYRFSTFESMLSEIKTIALKGVSPAPFMVSEQEGKEDEAQSKKGGGGKIESSEQTGASSENTILKGDPVTSAWQKQARKDVQSLKLVSFDGKDWLSWRITVELQLGQIDMLSYLRDPTPGPSVSQIEKAKWEVGNALVRSYLLDRLGPGVKRTVLTYSSARQTWERLEEMWGANSVGAQEDLLDEWEDFHQAPSETMREYIDNLNHLVLKIEFSKLEGVVSDKRKRHKLLKGLDAQWKHLKDVIKLSDMGYAETCKRLLETGKREQDTEVKAFPVRRPNSFRGCFLCGDNGHYAKICTRGIKSSRGADGNWIRSCYECNQQGHYARDCPSKKETSSAAAKSNPN